MSGAARVRGLPALLLAVVAIGCQRTPSPGVASRDALPGGRSIEWQGRRACVDCDGIATRLVLAQGDGRQEYELTETYFVGRADARFAEHGHWRRDAAMLDLQGDAGSRRTFALLPDGRLQPSDGHGDPLSPDEDALLVPVAGTGPAP